MIYDALRLRKPALHLSYLISLEFDFENYMTTWKVNNTEELQQRLNHFLDGATPTYSEDEALGCLAALVGSEEVSTIAERYYTYIDSMITESASQAAVTDQFPANSADAARQS